MARRRALITGMAILAVAATACAGCSKPAAPPAPAVQVTDTAGALSPGVTVSVTPESGAARAALAGSSAIGGAVRLAASDDSTPKAPLELTFAVDASTADGHAVVAVHLAEDGRTWTPEPARYNHLTHVATVTTADLGVWDVLAWDGGIPAGTFPVPAPPACGEPPAWVSEIAFPTEDPAVPMCVGSGAGGSAAVTVTNQHAYPVTVQLGSTSPTVTWSKAAPGGTWGRLARSVGGAGVPPVLGPGESATLTYARPAVGTDPIHVDLTVQRDPLSAWVGAVQAGLSTAFAGAATTEAAQATALDGLLARAAKAATAKACASALKTMSAVAVGVDTAAAGVQACTTYLTSSLTADGLTPAAAQRAASTATTLATADVVEALVGAGVVPALAEAKFTMTPAPVTTTHLTVTVKGCFSSCTFRAYNALNPAHLKEFGTKARGNGTLTWTVPVELTRGLVLQIGGPNIAATLVVFQYTGVEQDARVSPETAANAGSGIGCWVGTGRAEETVILRVAGLGKGADGKRRFAAWLTPSAVGLGAPHPTPKGALAVIPSPCT